MGFNQTHPGTDSRDVSVHPIIKRPPNQGGLFYWMAVRLILVPPIIVRVVVGGLDPDGVLAGRGWISPAECSRLWEGFWVPCTVSKTTLMSTRVERSIRCCSVERTWSREACVLCSMSSPPLVPSEPRQKPSAAAKEHVLVSAVVRMCLCRSACLTGKSGSFFSRVSVSVSIISYFLLCSLIA